jgi:hypothetical protein
MQINFFCTFVDIMAIKWRSSEHVMRECRYVFKRIILPVMTFLTVPENFMLLMVTEF